MFNNILIELDDWAKVLRSYERNLKKFLKGSIKNWTNCQLKT
jgi:hypothetical protein